MTQFVEPPAIEVFITNWLGATLGSGWYRRHIESLGLKGNETVMDFGSGAGIGAKYAARILQKGSGHLTCVDISAVWIKEAKKRLRRFDNVDFRLGDICALGLKDGTYDAIIISFVLHDIPEGERSQKLKCLASKLKKGGKIFITEPVDEGHGMLAEEVRGLMADAGMAEEKSAVIKVPMMGPSFDATFVKR